MKSLFLILTVLFTFSANMAQANELNFQDSIQEGKIEAAYLNMLREDINKAEAGFEHTVANLDEPINDVEGKIQAAMIDMIETEIKTAKVMHSDLSNEEVINDETSSDLRKQIELVKDLTAELSH